MLLTARRNSFIFVFPKTFFAERVKTKYKENYLNNLLLPYDNVEDYMASTIQSVAMPGWEMDLASQTRELGKKQEFKSSRPVEDLFTREFTVKFQMADGFLNYFIFLENAIEYLRFDNKKQYDEPFSLLLINNEGYLLARIDFFMIVMMGMSNIELAHNLVNQEFNTFEAKFKYMDWRMNLEYASEHNQGPF